MDGFAMLATLKGWITVQDDRGLEKRSLGRPLAAGGRGTYFAGEGYPPAARENYRKEARRSPPRITQRASFVEEVFFEVWQPYLFLDNAPLGQGKVHDSFKGRVKKRWKNWRVLLHWF